MGLNSIHEMTLLSILMGTDYLKRLPQCGPAFWRKLFKDLHLTIHLFENQRTSIISYALRMKTFNLFSSSNLYSIMIKAMQQLLTAPQLQIKLNNIPDDLKDNYLASFKKVLNLVLEFNEGDEVTLMTNEQMDARIHKETVAKYENRVRTEIVKDSHKAKNEFRGKGALKFSGHFPNIQSIAPKYTIDGLGNY